MEGDTILDKNVIDTLEETEQGSKNSGPEEDVVNYNQTAKVSRVVWVPRVIKDLPFGFEDTHHTGIKGWSVARPKMHHTKGPLLIVGCKEGEFLLIAVLLSRAMKNNRPVELPKLAIASSQQGIGYSNRRVALFLTLCCYLPRTQIVTHVQHQFLKVLKRVSIPWCLANAVLVIYIQHIGWI